MTVSSANLPTTLWQPFSVELDASGNGSTNLGAPNLGTNWLAYAVVSECPNGQLFAISVSGVVVAHGGTQSPTFAAGSGQTVAITVTGGTASSTLQGVLQGTIQAGNSPQSPQSSAGSLTQVSGGTIIVDSGDVTIESGQNGVNVSIDTPPVQLGTTMYLPDTAPITVTQTVTPDASATGLGVLVFPQGAATLGCSVTGETTGVKYIDTDDINGLLGASGSLLTCQVNGNFEDLIVEITSDTLPSAAYAIAQVFEYLGNSVVTVDNPPSAPVYSSGSYAAQLMSTDGTPDGVDQLVLGTFASEFAESTHDVSDYPDVLVAGVAAYKAGSALPRTVDMVVQGTEASSGAAVPVAPVPPQNIVTNSYSNSGTEVVAGVSGESIRLRHLSITCQTSASGAAWQLLSGSASGTAFFTWWADNNALDIDFDFEGFELPEGDGIYIHLSQGTADGQQAVTLTYDQY